MKLFVPILLLVLIVAGSCEDEVVTPHGFMNSPPQIVEQGDTFTAVGDTLVLHASASDPDGDPILYQCIYNSIENPDNTPDINIHSYTGEFWYLPNLADTVEGVFSFVACDEWEACDTTSFSIDIKTDPGICIIFENCSTFAAWYYLNGEYQGIISSEEQKIVNLDPGTYVFYARSTALVGGYYFCWESTVVVFPDKLSRLLLDCTGAECPE